MGDIYTNPPQSRNEAILRATIDGTEYTAPPQSRIEDLLLELKEAIEQGGTGEGDMKKSVYDSDNSVATAGGIKMFVNQKIGTLPQRVGSLETTAGVLEGEVASIEDTLDNLGTASTKNSTSVVTQSTDLVESGAVYDALAEKADNSVIGTVEDGANPTKSYAVGEHMIRGGKFCTVTVAVTTSSTWTLGSNYVEGTIADLLNVVEGALTVTDSSTFVLNYAKKIHNIVCVAVKKEISYTAGEGAILLGTLPNGFIPNQEFYTVFTDPNGEYMGRIAINTLGRIFAKPSVTLTNKTIGFTVTYII